MKAELLRCWTMDIFDPQFNFAAGASVLAVNPIAHHHNDRENLIKDLIDLLDGPLARYTNKASDRGKFIDTFLDQIVHVLYISLQLKLRLCDLLIRKRCLNFIHRAL